jgi:uncharacterized protein (TIGR03067 family)
MFAKPLWLSPLLVVALAQPADDAKAKKDLAAMQGTWTMHALEVNGENVPAAKIQNSFLIIKGDEYRTKVKDKLQRGFRLKLDPSKTPAHLDMIQAMPGEAEKTFKAIYKLENDTLKICRGLTADQDRPKQFATWPDTNYFVVTWKRQPK